MGDRADGEELNWRVPGSTTLLKAAGLAVGLVALIVSLDDPRAVILCGVLVVALAVLVVRDLLVPVRLAADGDGVTVVRGFAGKDRIPWGDVERITVDVRHRYGRRWEHLEIDTGDRVYVLTAAALGTSCTDAAARLRELKTGRGRDARL